MNMIDVKNLKFGYSKERLVLDDISLTCESSSINILLGLNGSGKTTLIKSIAGLYEPFSGEILLEDKNLKDISIKARSKILAYVAQSSNLISDFLVKDYLLFGTVNKMIFYQSPKQNDIEKVEENAERFGIQNFLIPKYLSAIKIITTKVKK